MAQVKLLTEKVLVIQSCLTLCNPMDCSPQAALSMEFSKQEYWSGLPFPPPWDLPNPRIKPRSPAWQANSLPSEPPGEPKLLIFYWQKAVDVDKPNVEPEKCTTYREAVATRHTGRQWVTAASQVALEIRGGTFWDAFFFLMTALFVLQDLSSPTRDWTQAMEVKARNSNP